MLRALPSQNSLEKSTYDKDKEVLPQDELFDYGAEGSLTRSVSTHLRVSIALCICVCSRARTHTHVRACAHACMLTWTTSVCCVPVRGRPGQRLTKIHLAECSC